VTRELVPVRCKNCRFAGYIEEEGYCPRCGAGPAIPSDERVGILGGGVVRKPPDEYLWGYYESTKPVSQTISRRTSVGMVRQASEEANVAATAARRSTGAPPRWLTGKQVHDGFQEAREANSTECPTMLQVAECLPASESTLKRWIAFHFGKGRHWTRICLDPGLLLRVYP
jgi:hypothetical protein